MLSIELRPESPADFRAVEELTRNAFWNHHAPGCDEHYLAHILRESSNFVPELDYVAVQDGKVVGSIMYTRARIVLDRGGERGVLCFGPLAVEPAFQGQGVGGALIERTKVLAQELGYGAILIFGDPAYYSRFGFVPAEQYGVGTSWGVYIISLQAWVPGNGLSEDRGGNDDQGGSGPDRGPEGSFRGTAHPGVFYFGDSADHRLQHLHTHYPEASLCQG